MPLRCLGLGRRAPGLAAAMVGRPWIARPRRSALQRIEPRGFGGDL